MRTKLTWLFRKNFLAGILVLIPFFVVGWIFLHLIRFLRGFHRLLPHDWDFMPYMDPYSASLLKILITFSLLILILITISFIGWLSKQFLGKKLILWMETGIERIPVVRSIYGSLNQLLKTLGSTDGQQFNRVVYFEFPKEGTWSLGFVTGQMKSPFPAASHEHEEYVNIFVPTTPNPTSGFYLIVKASKVVDSKLTVEEAFKQLLSLGVAQS